MRAVAGRRRLGGGDDGRRQQDQRTEKAFIVRVCPFRMVYRAGYALRMSSWNCEENQ